MGPETTEAPVVENNPAPDNNPPAEKPEGEQPGDQGEQAEKAEAKEEPPKKEKTPEEREIARLRRRVGNLTRRLHQGQPQQLQAQPINATNQPQEADSEPLSLSRAELQRLIDQEARKLAPTIKQQEDAIEHRRAVVEKLSTELGSERFDALAAELDDAFDGLKDGQGRPKPAAEAIFEAEDPRALIEYLTDPDNAAEAAAISRMNALQAGRALAKLELKLGEQKAKAKPQPSKATAPIEPLRGAGGVRDDMPRDDDSIDEWVRKERKRMAAKGR